MTTNNETVTQQNTGNGLRLERTEKPGGSTPWWWISDASRVPKIQSMTYRHRETLKAYGCRWSRKRKAWYFIGAELPAEITALTGVQDETHEPESPDDAEARQAAVLRHFAAAYQADLARLLSVPALPAVATIRLDDPWA